MSREEEATQPGASPEFIQEEIARTRARIDDTLDAVRERFQPQAVRNVAREWLIRSFRGDQRRAVRPQATERVKRTARQTVTAFRETGRTHPISFTLIGVGIALWFYERYRAERRIQRGREAGTIPREAQPVPERTAAEPIYPQEPSPDVAAQRAAAARTAAERRAAEEEVERVYDERRRAGSPPPPSPGRTEER